MMVEEEKKIFFSFFFLEKPDYSPTVFEPFIHLPILLQWS
jgi:hypothetical protein